MHTAEELQNNSLTIHLHGSMSYANCNNNMATTSCENIKEKPLNADEHGMDNLKAPTDIADNTSKQEMMQLQGEKINTEREKHFKGAPEIAINKHAELDKISYKNKPKRKRELGELGDNHILSSRLRSSSGKVYTSSVSVEAGSSTSLGP